MRCPKPLFLALCERFRKLASEHPNARKEARTLGASDVRFAWDMLWSLETRERWNPPSMLTLLYDADLHDTHVQTALLRAVKEAWPV